MHQIIRAIVYAKNKEEALEKAKEIFENLCGENGQPFDYFTTFDEEGSSVSGRGRWGTITPVTLATSKQGKKLIDDGMKYTKNKFMESIEKVRDTIKEFTNQELFEEEIQDTKTKVVQRLSGDKGGYGLSMFRYFCGCVGEYRGSNIYLYDNDGEGIRKENHLKDVLSKWRGIYEDAGKKNPNKDLKIFLIPADVHY